MTVPISSGAEVEQTAAEAQQWLADELSARHKRSGLPSGPARHNGTASALADSKSTQPVAEGEHALIGQQAKVDEIAEAPAQHEQAARETSKELERARKELDKAREAKDAADSKLKKADKEHKKREADLEKRFNRRQAALEKQLDDVEERLDSRDAGFREQANERERTLNSRIEELESALAEAQQSAIAKPARRSSRRKGKLDLNEVSFEQLRNMGLSVTLSARVMAYRDVRKNFQSLDELDEIPGLSVELKRMLREQLTVG